MMWVYQCLDIIATLTEHWDYIGLAHYFVKTQDLALFINKWIIMGGNFALAYVLTWCTDLGAYKIPLIFIIMVIMLKICYRDSIYCCIISEEVRLMTVILLSEGIGLLLGNYLYGENMILWIEGYSLLRWEIYIITLVVRLLSFFALYRIYRKITNQFSVKDFFIITIVFIIGMLSYLYGSVGHLNIHKVEDFIYYIITSLLPTLFYSVFCVCTKYDTY